VAARGTEAVLRALDEGAVGIVTKPTIGVRNFLHESALVLIDMVRSAGRARVRRRESICFAQKRRPIVLPRPSFTAQRMVAIGASTGGTEALTEILSAMPADAPGMVIVRHMPEHFTAAVARRLNELCQMEVKEAEDGDPICAQGRCGHRGTGICGSSAGEDSASSTFLTDRSSPGTAPAWMCCFVPWRHRRDPTHWALS
jgi:two-component system, chemotaxis family, protein-glutamate methylesterase/glutaminase